MSITSQCEWEETIGFEIVPARIERQLQNTFPPNRTSALQDTIIFISKMT
ncbi:cupin [Burkholderia pseudomallei]|nr:cupin [Burkholderia pseudomallei]EXJ02209.1 cupin [Burkholderia pseudomallei MSHR6137]PNW94966.1 cupin [Burkholderia sp. 136(2017)]PNX12719.1 cupin [Burkholderia sp. 129]PNX25397.1 cupin [Burkholderia sp. 117]PNX31958.1 cupin [Burkholderia sp. 137]